MSGLRNSTQTGGTHEQQKQQQQQRDDTTALHIKDVLTLALEGMQCLLQYRIATQPFLHSPSANGYGIGLGEALEAMVVAKEAALSAPVGRGGTTTARHGYASAAAQSSSVAGVDDHHNAASRQTPVRDSPSSPNKKKANENKISPQQFADGCARPYLVKELGTSRTHKKDKHTTAADGEPQGQEAMHRRRGGNNNNTINYKKNDSDLLLFVPSGIQMNDVQFSDDVDVDPTLGSKNLFSRGGAMKMVSARPTTEANPFGLGQSFREKKTSSSATNKNENNNIGKSSSSSSSIDPAMIALLVEKGFNSNASIDRALAVMQALFTEEGGITEAEFVAFLAPAITLSVEESVNRKMAAQLDVSACGTVSWVEFSGFFTRWELYNETVHVPQSKFVFAEGSAAGMDVRHKAPVTKLLLTLNGYPSATTSSANHQQQQRSSAALTVASPNPALDRFCFTSDLDGVVNMWETATMKHIQTIQGEGGVEHRTTTTTEYVGDELAGATFYAPVKAKNKHWVRDLCFLSSGKLAVAQSTNLLTTYVVNPQSRATINRRFRIGKGTNRKLISNISQFEVLMSSEFAGDCTAMCVPGFLTASSAQAVQNAVALKHGDYSTATFLQRLIMSHSASSASSMDLLLVGFDTGAVELYDVSCITRHSHQQMANQNSNASSASTTARKKNNAAAATSSSFSASNSKAILSSADEEPRERGKKSSSNNANPSSDAENDDVVYGAHNNYGSTYGASGKRGASVHNFTGGGGGSISDKSGNSLLASEVILPIASFHPSVSDYINKTSSTAVKGARAPPILQIVDDPIQRRIGILRDYSPFGPTRLLFLDYDTFKPINGGGDVRASSSTAEDAPNEFGRSGGGGISSSLMMTSFNKNNNNNNTSTQSAATMSVRSSSIGGGGGGGNARRRSSNYQPAMPAPRRIGGESGVTSKSVGNNSGGGGLPLICPVSGTFVNQISYDPESQLVLGISHSRVACVYSAVMGNVVGTLSDHSSVIVGGAIVPSKNLIYIATKDDKTIHVYDLRTFRKITQNVMNSTTSAFSGASSSAGGGRGGGTSSSSSASTAALPNFIDEKFSGFAFDFHRDRPMATTSFPIALQEWVGGEDIDENNENGAAAASGASVGLVRKNNNKNSDMDGSAAAAAAVKEITTVAAPLHHRTDVLGTYEKDKLNAELFSPTCCGKEMSTVLINPFTAAAAAIHTASSSSSPLTTQTMLMSLGGGDLIMAEGRSVVVRRVADVLRAFSMHVVRDPIIPSYHQEENPSQPATTDSAAAPPIPSMTAASATSPLSPAGSPTRQATSSSSPQDNPLMAATTASPSSPNEKNNNGATPTRPSSSAATALTPTAAALSLEATTRTEFIASPIVSKKRLSNASISAAKRKSFEGIAINNASNEDKKNATSEEASTTTKTATDANNKKNDHADLAGTTTVDMADLLGTMFISKDQQLQQILEQKRLVEEQRAKRAMNPVVIFGGCTRFERYDGRGSTITRLVLDQSGKRLAIVYPLCRVDIISTVTYTTLASIYLPRQQLARNHTVNMFTRETKEERRKRMRRGGINNTSDQKIKINRQTAPATLSQEAGGEDIRGDDDILCLEFAKTDSGAPVIIFGTLHGHLKIYQHHEGVNREVFTETFKCAVVSVVAVGGGTSSSSSALPSSSSTLHHQRLFVGLRFGTIYEYELSFFRRRLIVDFDALHQKVLPPPMTAEQIQNMLRGRGIIGGGGFSSSSSSSPQHSPIGHLQHLRNRKSSTASAVSAFNNHLLTAAAAGTVGGGGGGGMLSRASSRHSVNSGNNKNTLAPSIATASPAIVGGGASSPLNSHEEVSEENVSDDRQHKCAASPTAAPSTASSPSLAATTDAAGGGGGGGSGTAVVVAFEAITGVDAELKALTSESAEKEDKAPTTIGEESTNPTTSAPPPLNPLPSIVDSADGPMEMAAGQAAPQQLPINIDVMPLAAQTIVSHHSKVFEANGFICPEKEEKVVMSGHHHYHGVVGENDFDINRQHDGMSDEDDDADKTKKKKKMMMGNDDDSGQVILWDDDDEENNSSDDDSDDDDNDKNTLDANGNPRKWFKDDDNGLKEYGDYSTKPAEYRKRRLLRKRQHKQLLAAYRLYNKSASVAFSDFRMNSYRMIDKAVEKVLVLDDHHVATLHGTGVVCLYRLSDVETNPVLSFPALLKSPTVGIFRNDEQPKKNASLSPADSNSNNDGNAASAMAFYNSGGEKLLAVGDLCGDVNLFDLSPYFRCLLSEEGAGPIPFFYDEEHNIQIGGGADNNDESLSSSSPRRSGTARKKSVTVITSSNNATGGGGNKKKASLLELYQLVSYIGTISAMPDTYVSDISFSSLAVSHPLSAAATTRAAGGSGGDNHQSPSPPSSSLTNASSLTAALFQTKTAMSTPLPPSTKPTSAQQVVAVGSGAFVSPAAATASPLRRGSMTGNRNGSPASPLRRGGGASAAAPPVGSLFTQHHYQMTVSFAEAMAVMVFAMPFGVPLYLFAHPLRLHHEAFLPFTVATARVHALGRIGLGKEMEAVFDAQHHLASTTTTTANSSSGGGSAGAGGVVSHLQVLYPEEVNASSAQMGAIAVTVANTTTNSPSYFNNTAATAPFSASSPSPQSAAARRTSLIGWGATVNHTMMTTSPTHTTTTGGGGGGGNNNSIPVSMIDPKVAVAALAAIGPRKLVADAKARIAKAAKDEEERERKKITQAAAESEAAKNTAAHNARRMSAMLGTTQFGSSSTNNFNNPSPSPAGLNDDTTAAATNAPPPLSVMELIVDENHREDNDGNDDDDAQREKTLMDLSWVKASHHPLSLLLLLSGGGGGGGGGRGASSSSEHRLQALQKVLPRPVAPFNPSPSSASTASSYSTSATANILTYLNPNKLLLSLSDVDYENKNEDTKKKGTTTEPSSSSAPPFDCRCCATPHPFFDPLIRSAISVRRSTIARQLKGAANAVNAILAASSAFSSAASVTRTQSVNSHYNNPLTSAPPSPTANQKLLVSDDAARNSSNGGGIFDFVEGSASPLPRRGMNKGDEYKTVSPTSKSSDKADNDDDDEGPNLLFFSTPGRRRSSVVVGGTTPTNNTSPSPSLTPPPQALTGGKPSPLQQQHLALSLPPRPMSASLNKNTSSAAPPSGAVITVPPSASPATTQHLVSSQQQQQQHVHRPLSGSIHGRHTMSLHNTGVLSGPPPSAISLATTATATDENVVEDNKKKMKMTVVPPTAPTASRGQEGGACSASAASAGKGNTARPRPHSAAMPSSISSSSSSSIYKNNHRPNSARIVLENAAKRIESLGYFDNERNNNDENEYIASGGGGGATLVNSPRQDPSSKSLSSSSSAPLVRYKAQGRKVPFGHPPSLAEPLTMSGHLSGWDSQSVALYGDGTVSTSGMKTMMSKVDDGEGGGGGGGGTIINNNSTRRPISARSQKQNADNSDSNAAAVAARGVVVGGATTNTTNYNEIGVVMATDGSGMLTPRRIIPSRPASASIHHQNTNPNPPPSSLRRGAGGIGISGTKNDNSASRSHRAAATPAMVSGVQHVPPAPSMPNIADQLPKAPISATPRPPSSAAPSAPNSAGVSRRGSMSIIISAANQTLPQQQGSATTNTAVSNGSRPPTPSPRRVSATAATIANPFETTQRPLSAKSMREEDEAVIVGKEKKDSSEGNNNHTKSSSSNQNCPPAPSPSQQQQALKPSAHEPTFDRSALANFLLYNDSRSVQQRLKHVTASIVALSPRTTTAEVVVDRLYPYASAAATSPTKTAMADPSSSSYSKPPPPPMVPAVSRDGFLGGNGNSKNGSSSPQQPRRHSGSGGGMSSVPTSTSAQPPPPSAAAAAAEGSADMIKAHAMIDNVLSAVETPIRGGATLAAAPSSSSSARKTASSGGSVTPRGYASHNTRQRSNVTNAILKSTGNTVVGGGGGGSSANNNQNQPQSFPQTLAERIKENSLHPKPLINYTHPETGESTLQLRVSYETNITFNAMPPQFHNPLNRPITPDFPQRVWRFTVDDQSPLVDVAEGHQCTVTLSPQRRAQLKKEKEMGKWLKKKQEEEKEREKQREQQQRLEEENNGADVVDGPTRTAAATSTSTKRKGHPSTATPRRPFSPSNNNTLASSLMSSSTPFDVRSGASTPLHDARLKYEERVKEEAAEEAKRKAIEEQSVIIRPKFKKAQTNQIYSRIVPAPMDSVEQIVKRPSAPQTSQTARGYGGGGRRVGAGGGAQSSRTRSASP